MKKLYIILSLVFVAIITQAQRFEWAKGFEVENHYKRIVGGITDSLGNLYILSSMDALSSWDDENLKPPIGKTVKSLPYDVLIAKISPEGELVWKKAIFSGPNIGGQIPQDIKKIGDTAFACLIEYNPPAPYAHSGYHYYLDTFIVLANNYSHYPIDVRGWETGAWTLYLVFDFDGNVKEQHFLNITYTDTTGNDIVSFYRTPGGTETTPWLLGTFYQQASFDIDNEGNIYISRCTADQYNEYPSGTPHDLSDGSIGGYKFWVDKRLAGEYTIEGEPKFRYPQLMKFSPHFDTLLLCKYLFEKSNLQVFNVDPCAIRCVDNNRIIILGMISIGYNNTIVVDSSQNISITYLDRDHNIGYLIMYNDSLRTSYCVYLKDSIIGPNVTISSFLQLPDFDFDIDSNKLFISGRISQDWSSNSVYALGNNILNIEKNDAFVLSLDLTTGDFQRLMVVPSVKSSDLGQYFSPGNLLCRDNRVFVQNRYFGGMRFPNQNIQIPAGKQGLCLTMFDYSGRVIGGIDYNSLGPDNQPGSIIMHDSILYLHNMLKTSARFGDVDFPVVGATNCIAKYVDTALMHPYVWSPVGIGNTQAEQPRVYPVPATDVLHFVVPNGTATKATAISVLGNKTALPTKGNSADISTLAPGAYILEISTGKVKYYSKFVKQ